MERRNTLRKSSKTKTNTNRIYMDLKEILREHALCYLPAKALYRSLAVCRDWKLQISTPFFVHNQSVFSRSISGVFIQSPGSKPSFISLDQMAYGVPDPELKFLPEPVHVKSSSNGLLLCQGHTGDKPYYVCNPVNQQWKKLPKPSTEHGSHLAHALVFEPSLMNFVAEYKVVCIFASTDIDEAYEFEIYSSVQDSWKVAGEMFFTKTRLSFKTGIYVDGVICWPTTCGKIVNFDMKKERVMEVRGFYSYYGYGSQGLGEVDGKLCLSSVNGLHVNLNILQNKYANTMPMNSMTRAWTTKHQVMLQSSSNVANILLIWDNVIVFEAGGVVSSFDLRTQKTTFLCNGAGFDSSCAAFPYINSLVCLI